MDVDKLFKLPTLPQSSVNKRKWQEPNAAALKAARVDDDDQEEGQSEGVTEKAGVRDVDDDSDFAPGNDADYFIDEDDEGRFYGGGLTTQQKRILELMDRNPASDGDSASTAEQELRVFRKLLLQLERAINRNQEMRVKHSDRPDKFIESEVELHTAIRSLAGVTTNPALLYPELVKQSTTASLCNLIAHENIDIVASVIEVLEEMTDDDVLDAGIESRTEEERTADDGSRRAQLAVESVLSSLLQHSLLDLLVQTLPRLEQDAAAVDGAQDATAVANAESDAATTFHLLGVFENIVSIRPTLADQILGSDFRPWLLSKISPSTRFDQNKAYAAELLSALLQAGSVDDSERRAVLMATKDEGLDKLLEAIAPLRKHPPVEGDDESEFFDNLFDALCVLLASAENKLVFHKAEGVPLMCMLLKHKSFARSRALKVLNYATSGPLGSSNAVLLVQHQGLKGLFSAWSNEHASVQDEANAVEIIASLFNNLASGGQERERLIAKFERHGYERIDRLVEMHTTLHRRIQKAEKDFRRENRDPEDDNEEDSQRELYDAKLDAGLYVLQLVDYVIAWLIMENDGVLAHVKRLVHRRSGEVSLDEVVDVLKAYYDNVGEDVVVAPAEEEGEEPIFLQDVLVQLVNYLLGVM